MVANAVKWLLESRLRPFFLVAAAAKRNGVTVVMVSHQARLMAQLDEVLILNNGAVQVFGRSDTVSGRNNAVVRPIHSRPGLQA